MPILLLAGPFLRADAGPVAATIYVRGANAAAGVVRAKAADGRSAPVETPFRCDAGSLCRVVLNAPDGHDWLLTASAPGFWADEAGARDGEPIDIWPAGTIRGTLRPPKGGLLPAEVELRFTEAVARGRSADFPDEGSSRCPVRDGAFECVVPAGSLDLRIRAAGHVSVYRWQMNVDAGDGVDLGLLELRRGASIVGRVVSNDPAAPTPGACVVRLEPAAGSPAGKKTGSDPIRTTVSPRGFFHVEVVPPGAWTVVAEQEGFVAARRPITVVEGMEAALKEPIALSRPARLELTLLPPQDPDGRPWGVEVLARQAEARYDTVASGPATLAGAWSRDGLPAGSELQLRVRTAAGQSWWTDTQTFVLAGPIHGRTVDVGFEEVRGSVYLGEKPLAATITFGAQREMVAIALRADENGAFSGALPRLGAWHVVVSNDLPSVKRELGVEVRRGPEGRGRIDIVLQDRALVGEIVDEKGERLERAILTVQSLSGRERSQELVEGGGFRLTGFQPGRYLLSAEGANRSSEAMPVEIAEDGASPFLTIVARPESQVSLRVVSEAGSPVAGAAVRVLQTTQFPGIKSSVQHTDATGLAQFSVAADGGRQCFMAGLSGVSTLIADAAPSPEIQQVILPSGGGTIIVEAPPTRTGVFTLLWRGGCFVPLGLLQRILGSEGSAVAGLAPGEYRLCRQDVLTAGARPICTDGFLAPRGILTLRIEDVP